MLVGNEIQGDQDNPEREGWKLKDALGYLPVLTYDYGQEMYPDHRKKTRVKLKLTNLFGIIILVVVVIFMSSAFYYKLRHVGKEKIVQYNMATAESNLTMSVYDVI